MAEKAAASPAPKKHEKSRKAGAKKALLSQPVFSAARLARIIGGPALPFWAAGRFAKSSSCFVMSGGEPEVYYSIFGIRCGPKEARPLFELRSNGLKVLFAPARKGAVPEAREGDWVAARFVREASGGEFYYASRWQTLASCRRPPLSNKRRWQTDWQMAEDWAFFLGCVQGFLRHRGLSPAETPSLVRCPGTEPHLQPFQIKKAGGAAKAPVFLPTSPEMSLKKLLCRGATDIFEIKKCFRAGELGQLHEPEFYLLEWYRAFWPLESLMDEIFALLKSLTSEKPFEMPLKPLKVFTVRELFQKFLGFQLSPNTERKELAALAKRRRGLPSGISDYSWEDLFHILFLRYIEPRLPKIRPVIIKDYPPRLRAFAKISPQGWAERFELYWHGIELANAFFEVTDAAEQERLFQEHLDERGDSVPADKELLALMDEHGMPPCSGAALGLDRLFLILSGNSRISDIRMFESGGRKAPAKASLP